MNIEQFLDKKEVEIGGKQFLISRIPTLKAHEIYVNMVKATGDYGKLGLTMLPMDIVRDLFGYCAAKIPTGGWTVLDTNDTVNTYLPSLFDCIQLQYQMCEYNFGFFIDGRLTTLLIPKAE